MRPYGSPKQLERRRMKALALLDSGLKLKDVAKRVGVGFSSVYRWRERARRSGEKALRAKPASGRPRRLRKVQCRRLLKVLLKGALEYGFPNDLWTLKRIAGVIRQKFGVRYHHRHVWRILRGERWSCQVPERRAIQRDEKAIAHWKRYKWPHIKKVRKAWGPYCLP